MKIIFQIFMFICTCVCVHSQTNISIPKKTFTKNFEKDVNSWFYEGEVTVRITDLVTMSPRRQELITKFSTGIKNNPDFYLKRLKLVEDSGMVSPFDARLGLTIEEWREIDSLNDDLTDMVAESSGTAKLKIFKSDSIISFKTNASKLNYLNFLIINTRQNIAKMRELDYILKPVDTFCVTNENNVYKTRWCGYQWEFSNIKNKPIPSNQEELSKFSALLLTLTIGYFEKTGETFLHFKVSQIEKGKQALNYDVPIIFE